MPGSQKDIKCNELNPPNIELAVKAVLIWKIEIWGNGQNFTHKKNTNFLWRTKKVIISSILNNFIIKSIRYVPKVSKIF